MKESSKFKELHTFEARKKISDEVRTSYPYKVPVILEPSLKCRLKIEKQKFLVSDETTVGKFLCEVRKHINSANGLTSQEALFIFVKEKNKTKQNFESYVLTNLDISKFVLPSISDTIISLYNRYADDDGFLYITYAEENTFGFLNRFSF